MKKLLSIMCASVAAIAVGSSLVACGSGRPPVVSGTSAVDHTPAADLNSISLDDVNDPIADGEKAAACELTVWAPDASIKGYEELAKEFTSTYKGGQFSNVKVTFQAQAEGDVASKLTTDPSVGADVFFFEQGQIAQLYQKNILQPFAGDALKNYSKAIIDRDGKASADPAILGGYAVAFPATADNTWFMWYDSSLYSEKDIVSFDKIVEKAKKNNKNIMFDYGNGWYISAFWQSTGGKMDFNNENKYQTDINDAKGLAAAKAVYKYLAPENNKMANGAECIIKPSSDMNSEIPAGMKNGTIAAGFIGSWVAKDMPETAKPAVTPVFSDGEKDYQMVAFCGSKYCGVNAQRPNKEVAAALANFLTSEKGQLKRFAETQAAPSNNKASENADVKANAVVSTVADQIGKYGYPQNSQPQAFWDGFAAYGNGVATGTIKEADLQSQLDQLAAALTA